MKVEIRQWYLQDKEAFARLNNTVDCTYDDHFVEYPCSEDDADYWIKAMVDSEYEGNQIYRAIVAEGEVVGLVSVTMPRGNHCVDGKLGYMMMPEFCGKGIATEAVRLMVNQAFRRKPYERLSATVYEPNIVSVRVLEKNGFVLEGKKANAVRCNGIVYNTLHYGLLRSF
jgi:ribosomal-protein-alanine N-acetyltransferase